jgi:hypothetical protein
MQNSVKTAQNAMWDLFGVKKPAAENETSNVTFQASDGSTWTITKSKLDAAKQKDPGLKVIQ